MGTLSARTLRESLQKARNIGIVEERLQLFDECEVVVRNLRPDEYEAIHAECKELEEIAYLYGFQFGHVKRAIVELNGQDLRGVEYVEDSMGPRMSYHLARRGVLAVYSGNQPAVMRLMPSLVIEPAEVDFLLEALERAISDLVAGAGPEEPTPARSRRRPARPTPAPAG